MKTFFAAMFFMAGTFAYSQSCPSTLTGEVVDFHDGSPLVNAIIKIVDSNDYTYTDIDGKFSLKNLCDGDLKIQVIHPECEDKVLTIPIHGNTYKKIRLEHHLQELGEVTIVGKSLNKKSKTGQEETLKSDVLEKYSSVSLGDALKQLSGVSSLNTGNSIVKPVIQGLHSSRVLMMNNGVRLEDQEWGVEHAPNIDLNSAGSLTVIKGAAALQYGGDAIGGVVIAAPANIPVKDTLYGKTIFSASTNGRGSSLSSSLTKSYKEAWYWNVQGTLKKFGDYEAPDYMLSNTGTEEKDFSLNFGLNKFSYGFDAYYSYYNNKLGILRAAHIGNVNDLIASINQKKPRYIRDFSYAINAPRQEVEHHLARLKFYKRFENLGKLNVQYDFQLNNRLEYDLRVGDDRNKPSVDLELKTHRISTNFKIDAPTNYEVNVGAEGTFQVNFPDPATGVRRLIPDYDKYEAGVFATASYHVSKKLLAEAGMRYDFTRLDAEKYYLKTRWRQLNYDKDFSNIIVSEINSQYFTHPILDYSNFSFTGGLKYDLENNYELRFNYAQSNRAPNPSELFSDGLHQSAATIEWGDLRIGSETSNKFSLGLQKSAGNFTFNLSPFYNPINNFIYSEPSGVQTTIRGSFPVYQYKQINALLWGADVDAHYQLNNHFSYNGRFSYVRGTNRDTHEALIDIPAPNTYNAISYTNRNWANLELSLRSDFVLEQKHYPNNNFYFDVLQDGQYVSTLVDISTPPSSYFLLGFDASTSLKSFNKGTLEIGLSINNIFNTSYRDYLNRLRYYAANSGRNIILQLKFN